MPSEEPKGTVGGLRDSIRGRRLRGGFQTDSGERKIYLVAFIRSASNILDEDIFAHEPRSGQLALVLRSGFRGKGLQCRLSHWFSLKVPEGREHEIDCLDPSLNSLSSSRPLVNGSHTPPPPPVCHHDYSILVTGGLKIFLFCPPRLCHR